jgi:hypothetical protein
MKTAFFVIVLGILFLSAANTSNEPEFVHFQNQGLGLLGELFKPKGQGRPFPLSCTIMGALHRFAYTRSEIGFRDAFAFVQKHCTQSSKTDNPSFQRTAFGGR